MVDFLELVVNAINYIFNKNVSAVFTGHSSGGIIAKTIGSNFYFPSIAFESLNNDKSHFSDLLNIYTNIEYSKIGFQMINVFSPSQIFSQSDSNATMNIELPKWKGVFEYINPYEEMCLIAAGCVVDGRYDRFCDKIMGIEKYKYLFTLWNRTRSDFE